jgi:hypothetical protein
MLRHTEWALFVVVPSSDLSLTISDLFINTKIGKRLEEIRIDSNLVSQSGMRISQDRPKEYLFYSSLCDSVEDEKG